MQRIVGDLFGRTASRQTNYARTRGVQSVIRTSADPRTNSLIVIAKHSEIAVIEGLVRALDTPTTKKSTNVREGASLSQLNQRLDRLERDIVRLRSSADRSNRSGAYRSNNISRPRSQTGNVATVSGTSIRIEARPPKGGAMEVVSVVATGKRVKKGDLLLKIDTAPFAAAVNVQELEIERAKAMTLQDEASLQNMLLQLETKGAEGKLQIELAKMQLTEFKEGTHPLQLMVLEKSVSQCKIDLDEQKRTVAAGKANAITIEKLQVELEVAQTKLQVFQKFTVPKTLKELENAIALAERKAQQDLSQAKAEAQVSEARLAAHRTQFGLEVGRLKKLKDAIAKCNIVAPHDGVVSAEGLYPVRAGSQVRERQVVLILISNGANESSAKPNGSSAAGAAAR